ncbi:MAG TPA: glycosyltransferase [Dehalococcoidia bacterium]|nr:glycosyltransferase [Dehalococcoidia bacterium]
MTRRTAVLHPWLVETRGGEKVFFEIARLFPEADLFLLFGRRDAFPADLAPRIRTTFLSKLPIPRGGYRALLPLLPYAVESIDLSAYDTVISSSSGWTHGALARDGATHVCYMHTPPRYLWGAPPPTGASRLLAPVLTPLLQHLRVWDAAAAARVQRLIANSRATAQRIQQRYSRHASVLYPPVEVDRFAAIPRQPAGYALYVGELVEYKRVDLVVQACMLLGLPLRVAGDGPERARLAALAGDADVRFHGRVSETKRDELLGGASVFVHGGVEDFGMTFVEAMAAGVPLAGPRAGGLAEVGEQGGVSFATDESAEALAQAVARCLESPAEYTAPELARRFDASHFREAFVREVEAAVAGQEA